MLEQRFFLWVVKVVGEVILLWIRLDVRKPRTTNVSTVILASRLQQDSSRLNVRGSKCFKEVRKDWDVDFCQRIGHAGIHC